MIEYIIGGVVLVVLLVVLWEILKAVAHKSVTLLVNSVAGVLILLFLKYYLSWQIPLNIATMIICAIFGLAGVGTLVILYLAGMM